AALAKRWRLSGAAQEHLRQRYLLPQPRNALADALRRFGSGAMGVSRRMGGGLSKLLRASGLAADMDRAAVPVFQSRRTPPSADGSLIERILTGGDDYEILLTLPATKFDTFRAAAESAGVPVSRIGQVRSGQGVRFLREGRALMFAQASYSHF